MAQKNSLQFFILAIVVGFILLAGTFSFTSITKAVINPDSFTHFKKNTWIGPIDVSGLNKEQSLQLLSKKTDEWKQKNQMTSQFIFETVKMKTDTVAFDVQGSVNKAQNGQINPLQVSLNENLWNDYLSELGFTGQEDIIDFDSFTQDLLSFARDLHSPRENFNLALPCSATPVGVFEIAQKIFKLK